MPSHQLRTLPLDLDLTLFVGANLRREFRWLPNGEDPQDFTGWSALMLIGPQGGTALTELPGGDGIELTSTGRIIIDIPPARSASFPATSGDVRGTNLFYSLDLTDPGGFTLRFARGRIDVIVDVARTP